jgi:NadR type nicotinamide-nucleotide adenylyltransferase
MCTTSSGFDSHFSRVLAWTGAGWLPGQDQEQPALPAQPSELPSEGSPATRIEDFGPDEAPGLGQGIVLGRFMPPHRGHQFLIDFARNYVQGRLTVFLVSTKKDSIPGKLREAWLRELFHGVRVIRLSLPGPEARPHDPDRAAALAARLRDRAGQVHLVFSSERSTAALAGQLGAQLVLVDPDRLTVPISGTRIRAAPLDCWDFIPACVRPHFVKRVCLLGPEATGKSTLARQLAELYRTLAVGEYARVLRSMRDGELRPVDFQVAAHAQVAAQDALTRQANRVLICDTDLVSLWLWAERRFGCCPDWIGQQARQRLADLYLVTATDIPLAGDAPFDDAQRRQTFLERCQEVLRAAGARFIVLHGSWTDRLEAAEQAVGELLRGTPTA